MALLACDDTLRERLWEPSGGGGIYRMGDGRGDGERRSPLSAGRTEGRREGEVCRQAESAPVEVAS